MTLHSWLLITLMLQGAPEPKITLEYAAGKANSVPTSFEHVPQAKALTAKSFWIKVKISSETEGKYVLKAGNWYMQHVDFLDAGMNKLETGNFIELNLPKGFTIVYLHYPFVDEKNGDGVSITLSPVSDFYKEKFTMMFIPVVFISIVFFLFSISAIYSFVIHSSDNVYAHYAAYLMTLVIFFSYQYGLLGDLIPFVRTLQPGWVWIFSDFCTITYIYFTQSFLNLRQKDPLANKVFTIGRYFVLGMAVTESISLLLAFDIQHEIWYKGFVIAFELVTIPFVLYRVFRIRTTLSWFYLSGVAARSGHGGTAPAQVAQQIERLRRTLDVQHRWTAAYKGPGP